MRRRHDAPYVLAIAAGGRATRALVLTGYGAKPKAFVNAGTYGATVIDEIVHEASDSGVEEMVIILSSERDRDALERFFHPFREDPDLETYLQTRGKHRELDILHSRPKIRAQYVIQPQPRGFGEAIGLTYPIIRQGHANGQTYAGVLVALGDDLVHAPIPAMKQLMSAHTLTGSMMVAVQQVTREEAKNYGVVQLDPTELELGDEFLGEAAYRIVGVEEKPENPTPNRINGEEVYYAIVGRYALNLEDVEFLTTQEGSIRRELDFTSLLRRNVDAGTLTAVVLRGLWHSVGTWVDAQRAYLHYALCPQSGEPTPEQIELREFVRELLK